MDTNPASSTWANPFAAWDAALHWNRLTLEWMTTGWQQWLQLATAWPELESGKPATPVADVVADAVADSVTPLQAAARGLRAARAASGALDSRLRGNDGSRTRGNDGSDKPRAAARRAAKPAPKRTSSRRSTRPQAASRSTSASRSGARSTGK